MKKKVQLTKLAPNCGCAAKVGPGTLAGAVSYTHLTLPTTSRV